METGGCDVLTLVPPQVCVIPAAQIASPQGYNNCGGF